MELSRITDNGYRRRLVQYNAQKYPNITFDALVAIGPEILSSWSSTIAANSLPNSSRFLLQSVARLPNIERPSDVTGIVSDFDVSKTLSLAERLQPNARKLVVIAGAGPFDLQWAHIARKQLAEQETGFDARYGWG